MHFDPTVSLGSILQFCMVLTALAGIGFKVLRVVERLIGTVERLSDTVDILGGKVEKLTDNFHSVDKRVTIIEKLGKMWGSKDVDSGQ